MKPLAEFADGSAMSTFGRRQYQLFPDRIVACGGRYGQWFETTIHLDEIRPEPERICVHSQVFGLGAVLAGVTSVLLVITSLIFWQYEHIFTFWYLGGGLLIVLGVAGCWWGFRSIQVTRFLSAKAGVPLLAVIAQRRSKWREQEDFTLAIQNQLVELGKMQEWPALSDPPQGPASPDGASGDKT